MAADRHRPPTRRTPIRIRLATIGVLLIAALVATPGAGLASAQVAAPAGDVLSIGHPAAPQQVELFLDPMCPYSGQLVREQGAEIARRVEAGELHATVRFVDFLDKYSASGDYDSRAIYAAFVVADHSRSSDVAWRFIEQIYAADQQPHEGGPTDLTNDQLAGLADRAGAPLSAQDLIKLGLPIPFDAHAIAANNLGLLRQFPEPAVPLAVIDGAPRDGNSDWLDSLGHG